MKILLKINTHSYSDLVTNSSSELFVCTDVKSVEAVKEVVAKLADIHNQRVALSNRSWDHPVNLNTLWADVFQEPTVCEYDFNIGKYPEREEYWNVHNYHRNELHPVKIKCDNNWKQLRGKSINYVECYKAWDDLQDKTTLDALKWAFEQNNLSWPSKPSKKKSRGDQFIQGLDSVQEDVEEILFQKRKAPFEEALCWRYFFKKGDILLHSASDNSIPGGLMDDITNVFNAQRCHLG